MGDEEILSRKAKIIKGDIPEIAVGKMRYREIILSGSINLRSSTYRLLKEFALCGGKVIVIGEKPSYLDGYAAALDFSFAQSANMENAGEIAGRSALFRYSLEQGENFISVAKKKGKDYYLFICNFDRKNPHATKISVSGEYNVEKLNLRSGKRENINFKHRNNRTELSHSFAPSEELLLRITGEKIETRLQPQYCPKFRAPDVPIKYSLDSNNILVLDMADYYIDGEYKGHDEILHLDREVRLAKKMPLRGGEMVQPWYKNKFCKQTFAKPVCKLSLVYRFQIDAVPEKIALTAESPEDFEFFINEKKLDFSRAQQSGLNVSIKTLPFAAAYLAEGMNTLRVECDFSDKINLETLYLTGKFGVTAGDISRIGPLPETIRFGNITKQGFPFYSGSITYYIEAPLGSYAIEVADFYAECLKSGDNIAAFAPFFIENAISDGAVPLTTVLTRKNTFGPLHEIPALHKQCSPGDFITCGDMYSSDYQLIEQGVFSPPVLMKIEK